MTVGIDVSKEWVDFFVLNRKQDPSGRRPRRVKELSELAAELAALGPRLVVLEATGGLETSVWAALEAAGLTVAVVNPKRVRDFARSLGLLAKTDRLDARVLAQFGETLRPRSTPLPSRESRALRELCTTSTASLACELNSVRASGNSKARWLSPAWSVSSHR
jgi:transposase